MAQSEEQQLVVALEARITQFEREMKRATKVASDNYGSIEERGRRAARNMDQAFANSRTRVKTPSFDDRGLKNVGSTAKLTSQQLVILQAAARDAFASLASGQNAMTVLMQQGSNVQAAIGEDGVLGLIGGIGNGLKGLVNPATLAMTAVAAVGLGGAYAFSRFTEERLATELALTGIGRISGVTADDIRRMGDEIAATSKISARSAREIATAIAATGKVTSDSLADVANLAKGYAKLFGKDLTQAGKDLAGIFSDPAKGADTLDARLGMLDDRTRRYVQSLAAQGDRQRAIQVLIKAVQPELQRAAEMTTVWARAWEAVKSGADGALNSVARAVDRAVSGLSLQEQLAQLRAKRNGSESDYVAELKRQGLDERAIKSLVPTYQGADTKALDDQIRKTEELIAKEEERRKALAEDARTNEASKLAGEIVRSFTEEAEAIRDLQNRYEALGKALSDPAVVAKLDDADKARATYDALGKRVEALTADYKAGGTAAAQALRQADFQARTAGLASYQKGLAAINHEYDEQIRLARQAGDAASTAARVATIEAARGQAVAAYNRENLERAKASVGLPADFTASIIQAESNGSDAAKNPNSSATGAGQFISSTWLALFKRVYSEMAANLSDDAILALRTSREYSARLIEEYARENAVALQQAGFEATSANLHLAHFLGAGGAVKMLKADPSANAASILPDAAAANTKVFKDGSASVADILAYAQRRAQGGSSAGKASADRVTALRAEAEAYDRTAVEAEKLKAIQEQLDADREKGGELGKTFATASDLIKASSDKLTPALKAQRDEILALADARAKAAATGLSTRFETDIANAGAALGRTSGEQQDFTTVKNSYGVNPDSAEGQRMQGELSMIRTLGELKSGASSALSGLASDLMHGATAAQAFQNQLLRIADKLISMAADQLVSKAFAGMLGGGSSGGLFGGLFSGGAGSAGSGQVIGNTMWLADGGSVSGPGTGTSDSIPAWLSDGEYVIPAAQAAKHRHLLDAIRSGRVARFASGGLVGSAAMNLPSMAGSSSGPVVNAPINVNVGQGSQGPQADAALAKSIGKEIENAVRATVAREFRTQMRPGGLFRG